MTIRKSLWCLCMLFQAALSLAAQTETEAGKRPPAGRTAWFACLSKPEGLENPVKILAGEKITPLELPDYMASKAVGIPDDGVLRIVREVPDPAKQGKPKYLILAEAKIPEGVREALVILSPLPEPQGALLFRSKIQDLADFKGGDRLYINLSDSNIRVRLGKATVGVEPKQANIFKSPAITEATNVPIMYEFYHPERKQWMILTASTVVLRPTRREICVFNNGTRIGTVKKYGILFPVDQKEP